MAEKPKITDEQRNELRTETLQEVIDEMRRWEEEMKKDIYGSRDYCDGVRAEIGRIQDWLSLQVN